MADRGMGRGLAAILQVSATERGDRPELRDIAGRADRAQPGAATPALRRRRAGCARRVARRARRAPARPGAPAGRRHATSSSPVSAAGAPRSSPASRRCRRWSQRRDDAASLEVALVENMAREDLNPVEEARAVAALVEELGLTREEVGRRVGRSRVAVSNLLRILDLPDEVLELLEDGRLSEGHGRALLLAEEHAARRRLAHDAAERAAGRFASPRTGAARGQRSGRDPLSRGRPAAASRPGGGCRGDRRGARRARSGAACACAREAPATRSRSRSRTPRTPWNWSAARLGLAWRRAGRLRPATRPVAALALRARKGD